LSKQYKTMVDTLGEQIAQLNNNYSQSQTEMKGEFDMNLSSMGSPLLKRNFKFVNFKQLND
jgi:hypothetical protein